MNAKPITKSTTKLRAWQDTRELDQLAKQIAERERIALIEAYEKAADSITRPHTPASA
jgi:hypothetical protein